MSSEVRICDLADSYRLIVRALRTAETHMPDDDQLIWIAARHAAWQLLVFSLAGVNANAADLAAILRSAETGSMTDEGIR